MFDRLNKILILLLICGLAVACNRTHNPGKFNVQHAGILKNMMRKGDISAKADLDTFQNQPNLYALGALEKLKGEIMILAGRPYISFEQEGRVEIDSSFDHKAALLVKGSVEGWKAIDIPADVKDHDDLEAFIAKAAEENGIDVHAPFPFMLRGTPKSFDWHVINWKDGDTEHSHDKHITSGPHGTMTDTKVQILGFYSDSHHAIFTHHTTNMHMHYITSDETNAGHVDDIELGEGMKLLLPSE